MVNFRVLLYFLISIYTASASADQLNYGKYFGTLQMDGRAETLAISLDANVIQVNDETTYPALNIIVRANLGGYSSSEYVAYDFYSPTFNFEKSVLELNDPKNDLIATLHVTTNDTETVLEGPVVHRMTNSKGKMRVVMPLDDSLPKTTAPEAPLLSILKGDYFGTCGTDPAEMQIETGRNPAASSAGNALSGYAITGRLGFRNAPLCPPHNLKTFCVHSNFSTGSYSPFTGRLTLQGPLGMMDCNKKLNALSCQLHAYNREAKCDLTKKDAPTTPAAQIPSTIFLKVSADEKAPLPLQNPPENAELLAALNDDYYGFLHYENRDVYQLMQLSVVASTSTVNAHIQNQVMVAPTMSLRLGQSWDSVSALTVYYPQRVFGMNTGFSFQANDSDYIVVVGDWRVGYMTGVVYSRSFGRVGTFELRKKSPPEVTKGMKIIPTAFGGFHGPIDAPNGFKNIWNLSMVIPDQVHHQEQGGVPLLVSFTGPGMADMSDVASLDLNTNSLSFLIQERTNRLVSGEMTSESQLKLLWPIGPVLGAPMENYEAYTYDLTTPH